MKLSSKALNSAQVIASSPQLRWEDGVPVSKEYDDVYFSKADGLSESRHVFLSGNNLPERWRGSDNFTIAELGFGSGLNFLATWQAWKEKGANGFLHYLSIEAAPFLAPEIEKAISNWPELNPFVQKLIKVLPETTIGFHRLTFFDERLTLTLCYGNANDILPQVTARVDAWYLDGFAPAKNKELWNTKIFQEVARLSAAKATIATFSVARAVKEPLVEVGFTISKTKGYGFKREMLQGIFEGKASNADVSTTSSTKQIAIIGSGLAGSHLAYSLAARGAAVTVFEKGKIARGASGNPAGMIMPAMSIKPEARMRLSLCGVSRASNLLEQLEQVSLWSRCGVLRLVTSNRLGSLFTLLRADSSLHHLAKPLSAEEASQLVGLKLSDEAIFFPRGGIAHPEQICKALLNSYPTIKVSENNGVESAKELGDGWQITTTQGQQHLFDIVVIATGSDDLSSFDLSWIKQEAVRGQIAYIKPCREFTNLKTALCYDGYLLPESEGKHVVGATFEHANFDEQPGIAQEDEVLDKLCERAGINKSQVETIGARVGFRASTSDRYPVVGAVAKRNSFEKSYKPISYSRNWLNFSSDSFYQNLFISTGHASQGLSSTPIAAELIASLIYNEPLPLDKELVDLINPARILVREINRS